MDDGYSIHMWFMGEDQKAKLHRLPASSIQPTSKNRVWKIKDQTNPMAVALTWKGSWLGAWWNLELIGEYISRRPDLPEHDFAILKWLRVPILHSTLFSTVKKAILRSPCRFIKTWLLDSYDTFPDGIKLHNNILGSDSVIRCFLWSDFPVAYSKDAIVLFEQLDRKTNRENFDINVLARLSDISPALLWKGIEYYLKKRPKTSVPLIYFFTCAQVGLFSNASKKQLKIRLRILEKQVLNTSRIDEIIRLYMILLKIEKGQLPQEDRVELLKLGQTLAGRKYLSARMGLYWLDLSRM